MLNVVVEFMTNCSRVWLCNGESVRRACLGHWSLMRSSYPSHGKSALDVVYSLTT